MYNERNEGFSVRDIFIQLLFIVLFVFILIWLFPTKASVNSKFDALSAKIDGLSVLTNGIFEDNMATMKEAAINYYTDTRMPKNINDVKSMTLGEMLKEKLLIEFKDANNKTCDTTNSYVEVTKLEEEYQMKINLECSDNDAYIIVHLGCYNYCAGGVCEKTTTATKTNTITKPIIIPVVVKTYEYEYELIVNGTWGNWSSWSNWSTNTVTQTDYRRVEIDTRKEVTGTTQVKSGTDVVTVNATANTTTYCSTGYTKSGNYCVRTSNQTVAATCPTGYTQSGTTCTKTTTGTTTVAATCPTGYIQNGSTCSKTTGTTTYTKGAYVGTYQYSSARATYDSTYYYDFVSSDYVYNCDNSCTFKWVYTYKVYKRVPNVTSSTVYATPICPSGYTQSGFTCSKGTSGTSTASLTCPTGYTLNGTTCTSSSTDTTSLLTSTTYSCNSGYTLSGSTCFKVIDLYQTVNTYEYVTYYRYQTREYISGSKKVVWSRSKNDTNLLNQGYALTGKSREV